MSINSYRLVAALDDESFFVARKPAPSRHPIRVRVSAGCVFASVWAGEWKRVFETSAASLPGASHEDVAQTVMQILQIEDSDA